jgi:hypothetical protein
MYGCNSHWFQHRRTKMQDAFGIQILHHFINQLRSVDHKYMKPFISRNSAFLGKRTAHMHKIPPEESEEFPIAVEQWTDARNLACLGLSHENHKIHTLFSPM